MDPSRSSHDLLLSALTFFWSVFKQMPGSLSFDT